MDVVLLVQTQVAVAHQVQSVDAPADATGQLSALCGSWGPPVTQGRGPATNTVAGTPITQSSVAKRLRRFQHMLCVDLWERLFFGAAYGFEMVLTITIRT